jgi:hypothetical protein
LRQAQNSWEIQGGLNIPFGLERDSNSAQESVDWGKLPEFVKAEFEAILECRIITHEFRRLRRD